MRKALLSSAYLGPVQYFSKFILFQEIRIEQWENYQKQSYRNRCYIYGANGRQCLVIPVIHEPRSKIPIRDVKIDYSNSWQKIHWKSIESAYRHSPYFSYYYDILLPYYDRKCQIRFLFDFNLELLNVLLTILKIENKPLLTEKYDKQPSDYTDYRQTIHPKKRLTRDDPQFKCNKYPQVFQEKYGFLENLSIIDLLFNEGAHARDVMLSFQY